VEYRFPVRLPTREHDCHDNVLEASDCEQGVILKTRILILHGDVGREPGLILDVNER